MSMTENRLELFGLLGFLAFGVAVTCTLAYVGFLAYLAWKDRQPSAVTTVRQLTPQQIEQATRLVNQLNV